MNLDKLDPNLKTLYKTMQNTQTNIHSEVIMAREIGQYSSQVLKNEVRDLFVSSHFTNQCLIKF